MLYIKNFFIKTITVLLAVIIGYFIIGKPIDIAFSFIVPDDIGGGVDEYFYYSKAYYTITNNSTLFSNAWEHSLTVDVVDKDHYQNGTIEGVIIPQGVTSIGDGTFYDWESNNQPLVIPSSVTTIGDSAFANWSSNNQPLVIPNSVTSIGDSAFANWSSNNQPLVIPNSVTSIGEYTFYRWESNNQPLVIPSSVTTIGDGAFAYWSSAKEFIMESETPPTISDDTFYNTNNAPIYVPDESVDDYKTATNWESLASRIFPISDIENALDVILGVCF